VAFHPATTEAVVVLCAEMYPPRPASLNVRQPPYLTSSLPLSGKQLGTKGNCIAKDRRSVFRQVHVHYAPVESERDIQSVAFSVSVSSRQREKNLWKPARNSNLISLSGAHSLSQKLYSRLHTVCCNWLGPVNRQQSVAKLQWQPQ